jgi:hypothetical protein
MNQSKFSLADVLTILAAIGFGLVCFLGANFLNIGQEKVWGQPHIFGCVFIAVVIAVLLGGTAYGAKLLKRTSVNFKTCFVWEMVLLLLFAVFAVFFITSTSPFPHYFVVTAQKSQIQQQLSVQVEQTEKMFVDYEDYTQQREDWYEKELTSVIAEYNGAIISPEQLTKYGFVKKGENNFIPYADQKKKKIESLHNSLRYSVEDETSFEKMKTSSELWLSNLRKSVTGWRPISVVDVVNNINSQPQEWKKKFIKLSEWRETGESADNFNYDLSTAEVTNYFIKFGSPTPLSIGLAIGLYVLMLLSYIFTIRSTKSTCGFRALFAKKAETKGPIDIDY